MTRKADSSFERTDAAVRKWLGVSREARYRLGVALLQVQDLELWKEAGYASFHAYLDSLLGPSRRTLQRYMALAYKVDLALGKGIDPERIDYALALLPSSGGTQVITMKSIRALRIEVTRKGRVLLVPFDDAFTEELAAAVAARHSTSLPALSPAVEASRAAIAKRLGVGAGAMGDVRVRRRGKRQVFVIEVPVERGGEFLNRWK